MPKSNSPNKTKRNNSSSRSRSSSRSPNRSKTEKKTVKKCNKMPEHRIKAIIRFEKLLDSTFDAGRNRSSGYYESLEKNLKEFCFPKNFGYKQWNEISSYNIALRRAI
jgi:hypothetical protein